MSSTVENEFDPGTLHRLIDFRNRQKDKKLKIRTGAYTVQMVLDNVQKQFSIPDFDTEEELYS